MILPDRQVREQWWTDRHVEAESPAHLEELLKNPIWRICNLYQIKSKPPESRKIDFVPNSAQEHVIRLIYVEGKLSLIIIKARQMGFSTLIEVIIADRAFWGDGLQASIVDQTQKDATLKLDKAKLALESLQRWDEIGSAYLEDVDRDNDSALILKNDSQVFAGMGARGGTNDILHVSEWGPIAYSDPKRSEEIKTGALPSAEGGLRIVETTFKGAKVGDLWELCQAARSIPDEYREPSDWFLLFFPWWMMREYARAGDVAQVDPFTMDYLRGIEKQCGIKLSDEQKIWYFRAWETYRGKMKQEYPSTLDEALNAEIEGAIWGTEMAEARQQGRIYDWDWDRSKPVYTSWDLGNSDWTVIWFFQLYQGRKRYIDYYRCRKAPPMHYVQILRERGYPYHTHCLPHDGKNVNAGTTWKNELIKAGIPADMIVVVPRVPDLWIGINWCSMQLPTCEFHASKCDEGIRAMETYHTDETAKTVRPMPVHDEASHPCSAFRTGIEALEAGLIRSMDAMASGRDMPQQDVEFDGRNSLVGRKLRASRINGQRVYDQTDVWTD